MKRRWRIDITTEDGPSDGAAAAAQIAVAVNDLRLLAQGNRPAFSIKEVQVQRERMPLQMKEEDVPGDPLAVLVSVTDPENGETWQSRYVRDAVTLAGGFDWVYIRLQEEKKRRRG